MKQPWAVGLEYSSRPVVSDFEQRKIYRVGYVEDRVSWVAGNGGNDGNALEPLSGSKLATTAPATSKGVDSAGDSLIHFSETSLNRIRRLCMRP